MVFIMVVKGKVAIILRLKEINTFPQNGTRINLEGRVVSIMGQFAGIQVPSNLHNLSLTLADIMDDRLSEIYNSFPPAASVLLARTEYYVDLPPAYVCNLDTDLPRCMPIYRSIQTAPIGEEVFL